MKSLNKGATQNTTIAFGEVDMNLKRYRSQLTETIAEQLRYEFLKMRAQEGREHFIRQIAEENISDPSSPKPSVG